MDYWRPRRDLNPCYRRESGSGAKLQGLAHWGKISNSPMLKRRFRNFDLGMVCARLRGLAAKLSR